MNLLVCERLGKRYTEKLLFENVSFGIETGDKIGLIGVNGTGKSTLLSIIAGIEEADEGTVTTLSGLKVAYLPQIPKFDPNKSILQNVIEGKRSSQDYRNLEGEAAAMLRKLGIKDALASPGILSGGQKKRVALVRTLLTESDLLVLDEPTNHLDSEMTEWLEETLRKFKGAFLMVTHDRYFLDEVTNRIFELSQGNLYSYATNYAGFVERKAEREESERATERKNQALFRTELAWMLRGARARSTKQKAHIQRFLSLRDRKKLTEEGTVELTSAFTRLGKKTIELVDVCKSYGNLELIHQFSYHLLQNDRIGIIGPNGCGKTTLVKMMIGCLAADSGTISLGTTLKIGYFDQENAIVDTSMKVIDYIRDTAESITTKDGVISAVKMAENFLFDSTAQYSPISKLSGGEARRLGLLKILMSAPNALVLDEPTNDLDITTLTVLEDYLSRFEGILIAVSHDRYFLDKTVNRLLVFEGDGRIRQFEGNYTDYKNFELSDESLYESKKKPISNEKSDRSGRSQKPRMEKLKFTYLEQQEFSRIDDEIAEYEAKLAALEQEIQQASTEYGRLTELMAEKTETEALLDAKTERWVYLNDLADAIKEKQ